MHALGVVSHLFRGSPTTVAADCRRNGLGCIQLTPNFPGLSFHDPEQITAERCRQAAGPFLAAGLEVACLTGATPLMDSDLKRRQRGLARLHALIRRCRDFGTNRIVTDTGSLSPKSPWPPFPGNRSAEAWAELRRIVAELLQTAADHDVMLLLKPDSAHVLASIADAVRLREELAQPQLGYVLDPANFLIDCPVHQLNYQLEDLVSRLGPFSPVVHAKDLRYDEHGVATPRAGRGVLNYGLFFQLLNRVQPDAPVILEHLRPEEIDTSKTYLERFL